MVQMLSIEITYKVFPPWIEVLALGHLLPLIMASILFDDTDPHVKPVGPWTTFPDDTYLGGSAHFLQDNTGLFSVTFNGVPSFYHCTTSSLTTQHEGTSLSAFGTIDAVNPSDRIGIITIDGGKPFNTSIPQIASFDDSGVTQLFQTPTLADTTHTVTISNLSNVQTLDYVVVTAGNDTPLAGETLIVDDGDPAIMYDGTWTLRDTSIFSFPRSSTQAQPPFTPFGNATHHTNIIGSSATFTFTG